MELITIIIKLIIEQGIQEKYLLNFFFFVLYCKFKLFMSILLITNIIIKKERNLLFMELLSTAISYLNTYLLEKFSQKKYSTKLLVIFTITFLSFMLWQIYSGYSKALKLTSIIVSLPLISLISELIIPTFLSLFFISIIKNQVKEKMTQNKRLYYFKVSCCLQVYFYVLYFILIKLITKIKYNFCMFISMLILFFVLLLFASLYFKKNWIAKNIDKKYGLCLTLVIQFFEYTIVFLLIGHPNFLLLGILSSISSLIPYFGGFIVNVIAIMIAAVVSPKLLILTLIVAIVLPNIDGYIISPKVYGKTNNISPLLTIFAVFAGGVLGGFIGILIALPLTIILRTIFKYYKGDISKKIDDIKEKI